MTPPDYEILGYELVQTCPACPEQYDVFWQDKKVGYLRLRHGYFTAEYLYLGGGARVYSAETQGDGMFDPDERLHHLTRAITAINECWLGGRNKSVDSAT